MIKILHVASSVDPKYGGVSTAIRELCCATGEGVRHDIISLDDASVNCDFQFNGELYNLGIKSKSMFLNRELYSWLLGNHIDYQLIIVHGLWQLQTRTMARLSKETGKIFYVFPHGMLGLWFKDSSRLKHLKKFMYWILFERQALNKSSGLFCTCQLEADEAKLAFPGLEVACNIVGLGLRANSEHSYMSLPELKKCLNFETDKYFLSLGRLHHKKAIHDTIYGFAQFKQKQKGTYKLLIAGEGSAAYEEKLKNMVVEYDLAKDVHFVGFVSGAVKNTLIKHAAALVLHSYHENYGLVVAEALSHGTPVIISKGVQIYPEVARNEVGIVVENGKEAATDSFLKFVKWYKQNQLTIHQKCLDAFASEFSIENTVQNILQVTQQDDNETI